jgi:hypothetical protein
MFSMFVDVVPSPLTLSSDTSVLTRATWPNKPEEGIFHNILYLVAFHKYNFLHKCNVAERYICMVFF